MHSSVAPQDPYYPPSETGRSDREERREFGWCDEGSMKMNSPKSQPRVKLDSGF